MVVAAQTHNDHYESAANSHNDHRAAPRTPQRSRWQRRKPHTEGPPPGECIHPQACKPGDGCTGVDPVIILRWGAARGAAHGGRAAGILWRTHDHLARGEPVAGELRVELVAADRMVWSGQATIVITRTTEGDIGILPGHAPVLGLLVTAPVTIRSTDG